MSPSLFSYSIVVILHWIADSLLLFLLFLGIIYFCACVRRHRSYFYIILLLSYYIMCDIKEGEEKIVNEWEECEKEIDTTQWVFIFLMGLSETRLYIDSMRDGMRRRLQWQRRWRLWKATYSFYQATKWVHHSYMSSSFLMRAMLEWKKWFAYTYSSSTNVKEKVKKKKMKSNEFAMERVFFMFFIWNYFD